jgi:hypothetical protein
MNGLPSPGPVEAGQICDPANLPVPLPAGLACQLTSETITIQMPAQFLNALKGDIVLSPANGSLIGNMLMALSPAQYHSHSGLMTENFGQITHCTAAESRIGSYLDTDAVGIPTRFKLEQLQYLWPGSITQTVDESVSTAATWRDPQMPNKLYNPGGFVPEDQNVWDGGRFILIQPLVVKPLWENEGSARPQLQTAANIAIAKGATIDNNGTMVKYPGCYYSFYCYTLPEESVGFTDAADSSAHWAEGASPAVCSSFVWLCMKQANITCVTANKYETNSDFTPTAIADGATASNNTLDGLFFYSEAERQTAAQVLFAELESDIQNQEGAFSNVPILGSSIAAKLAEQIVNDFAFGNPDMAGKPNWKNPGTGNAVSPDNIMFWDQQCFGYWEPLQYLGSHTEQYTISRWVAVTQYGNLSGTITHAGQPAPGAHVWGGGMDTYADQNGKYTLTKIGYGPYDIHASWTSQDGFYFSNSRPVTISAPDQQLNIDLPTDPQDFRTIVMTLYLSCDHSDDNPFNAHGIQYEGPSTMSVQLSPQNTVGHASYSFDYNGGGYFNVQYNILLSLNSDLSVHIVINNQIYDDKSGQLQGTGPPQEFDVGPGQQVGVTTTTETTGFGYINGPAILMSTVTNNQT